MTHFLRFGNQYHVASEESLDIKEKLPVGTYAVKFDEFKQQFFLESVSDFEVSHKLYGDTRSVTHRIINTFKSRPYQTGVMLTGEKGSGKTLQAKDVSIESARQGIPTLLINDPWTGEAFNTFLQTIDQPVVVIFDEFEKVYDPEDQEKLLTIFDGVYPSRKLFIITCNDKYRVNSHMRNRPGRIYYRLDYSGLSSDFIREYCDDNLDNKSYIDTICKIAALFDEFNFDILKAMVAEMNAQNESPQEVMRFLNAKPEYSSQVKFDVAITIKGVEAHVPDYYNTWNGNPLSDEIRITHGVAKRRRRGEDSSDEDDPYTTSKFSPNDFQPEHSDAGVFRFVNSQGVSLTLTRAKPPVYHYDAF